MIRLSLASPRRGGGVIPMKYNSSPFAAVILSLCCGILRLRQWRTRRVEHDLCALSGDASPLRTNRREMRHVAAERHASKHRRGWRHADVGASESGPPNLST
jgi:hypothetical protein